MLHMTSDIQVGTYSNIKANKVSWRTSTGNFIDTCNIVLPLSPYMRKEGSKTVQQDGVMSSVGGTKVKRVNSVPFAKGDFVRVLLGYNNRNTLVFEGFVNRVNYTENLVLECEGYANQLREKYFSKSYQKTTLKQVLTDLIQGTDILLSPRIDDVPLTNVWFKNATAFKVLEWVQKELCCKVFFDGKYLYAGVSKFIYADPGRSTAPVRLRIGWNVINANALTLQQSESVQINIVEKDAAGTIKKTKSESKKYSNVKEVKAREGLPATYIKKIATELQGESDYSGYSGNIECFLEPHVFKCDKIELDDIRFPERTGSYFAEEIEGSFGAQGGRRTVKIRYYGN